MLEDQIILHYKRFLVPTSFDTWRVVGFVVLFSCHNENEMIEHNFMQNWHTNLLNTEEAQNGRPTKHRPEKDEMRFYEMR